MIDHKALAKRKQELLELQVKYIKENNTEGIISVTKEILNILDKTNGICTGDTFYKHNSIQALEKRIELRKKGFEV